MSNTNEWFHFQQTNAAAAASQPSPFFRGQVSDTAAVSGPVQAQLGPEGRVSKPGRQRARASKRTPTTMISTDTVNFRATVQQFTGGGQFPSLGGPGIGPGLGYGLPYSSNSNSNDIINPNNNMFMHYMGENNTNNNNNTNYNAYATNYNVSGGSSSTSENRNNNNNNYNNNFQF